jgi:hypothetical protein
MVFPGAVFSWEGKQHGLVRTDGHFRGWQSFPSGAPCGGGWNPGISPRARYKGALLCRPSLGGSCDNAPLILLPRSWPQGPGAPGSSGQDTSPTVKPTTRLAQTRRPTSSCTRRGGPFGPEVISCCVGALRPRWPFGPRGNRTLREGRGRLRGLSGSGGGGEGAAPNSPGQGIFTSPAPALARPLPTANLTRTRCGCGWPTFSEPVIGPWPRAATNQRAGRARSPAWPGRSQGSGLEASGG